MKRLVRQTFASAAIILFISTASAQVTDTGEPDFEAMPKEALVAICQMQHKRIATLEKKIEELNEKIAAGHGGSDAKVVGDITVINDGSWVVTIDRVEEVDTSAYEAEVATLRERLDGGFIPGTAQRTPGIADRIKVAEQNLQTLQRRGEWRSESNKNGYTQRELRTAENAVKRAEQDKRAAEVKIRELQRRIEIADRYVTATGRLEDGRVVRIEAEGVYAAAGQSLQPDQTYTIGGNAELSPTGGKITLKTAIASRE